MEETDQSSELLRGWELTGYGVEKTAETDPRNLQRGSLQGPRQLLSCLCPGVIVHKVW